ncbi:MAG: alpha/beta hydrolase [Pirellulales bacterium]
MLSLPRALAACIPLVFTLLAADGDCQDAPSQPDQIVVLREVRYREGASRQWTLDLAVPKGQGGKPRGAVVVIHGGGWIEGDKSSFSTADEARPANILGFAKLGLVAATINYRLAGEAPFPAALDDCRCAVRWLRAHAEEYRVDPARIAAYGNSAGGHLALLLGMMPPPAPSAGEPYADRSSRVQAVISDSGPIDLVWQHEHNELRTVVEKLLGGPPEGSRLNAYKRASPSEYAGEKIPPLLLIYGEVDGQVNIRTADEFVAALGRAGHKDVSYFRLAGVDHCPHSLVRVGYLQAAVAEFLVRTLRPTAGK